MTVGIAAICNWENSVPIVVCASDRMITAGDTEFEPPQPKMYQLTTSILMLIAGDTMAQTEILQGVRRRIAARLATDKSWMTIREAGDMVSSEITSFVTQKATRTVLEPLGLDFKTFVQHQREMRPEFYERVMKAMGNCRPEIETLVVGVDTTGSHIYEVDEWGDLSCRDAAGFGAIGAGRRHAESQFMFAKHAGGKPLPETFLLTYTAKKRAEAAPGVGEATDMCAISGLGNFSWIDVGLIRSLHTFYALAQKQIAKAAVKANTRINDYMMKSLEATQANVATPVGQTETKVIENPTPSDIETSDSTLSSTDAKN